MTDEADQHLCRDRTCLSREVHARNGYWQACHVMRMEKRNALMIPSQQGAFAKDFMRDIPRGLRNRFLREQKIPQASWQLPENILASSAMDYDPNDPGGKILIGALGDKLIGIEDNRHVLTVAGSRAGKSVTIVSNLLFYQGSVLATDPKAELASITAKRRAALGQKVYVLDPFGYASEEVAPYRAAYNPLAVLSPDSPTIIEDAGLIADALVIAAGKDPHWDDSARNFIEGLILHVATYDRYEGRRNLVTVRELIGAAMTTFKASEDARPEYALLNLMQDNAFQLEDAADDNDVIADLAAAIDSSARDFYEKDPREMASVLSTVRRHTKFLDYTAIRKVLSGHDFDLADLKREPNGITVYLCLPAVRMGMCNRWLRLFINQLLDAMEREKTKPKAPVLVCLDEFPVLGYMRQLEDAAGQIASFGVKLWVILQDWGQGKALYKERWETFAGNAGILQFFGNNDLSTTEYISKRLGKTMVEVARDGEVGQKQAEEGMTGRSQVTRHYELMAPEEIARHFARSDRLKRQLVMWAGYNPMILQRVEYYDDASPNYHWFGGKFETLQV